MKKILASVGIVSIATFSLLNTGFAASTQSNQDISALKARVAKMEATLSNITNNSKSNASTVEEENTCKTIKSKTNHFSPHPTVDMQLS